MTFEGGCLCGACRYVATGTPVNVRVCHCRRCQKALGAAFNARVLMPRAAVSIAGPVAWFASSPQLSRGFCPRCGTSLFSERFSLGTISLTFGSLDDPDAFRPTDHVWFASAQAWLCLDDGLPRLPDGPA